jgi:hypothetical protein
MKSFRRVLVTQAKEITAWLHLTQGRTKPPALAKGGGLKEKLTSDHQIVNLNCATGELVVQEKGNHSANNRNNDSRNA